MTSITKSNSFVSLLFAFVLGAVATVVLMWMGAIPCICDTSGDKQEEIVIAPEDGKELSDAEANDMSSRFKTNYLTVDQIQLEGSQGGRLNKILLMQMLAKSPVADSFINYSFGLAELPAGHTASTEPLKRIHLILYSGRLINRNPDAGIIVTNGTKAEYFCPTRCNDN